MSLERRPMGQGNRLVCNGLACGRKFNPRTPRPTDDRELRRRAALYGWTCTPSHGGIGADYCPDHSARGDS